MSLNQSRSDKSDAQYRKTGRSASFNPQRASSGGSGKGGGGGGGTAPQRSFRNHNNNANGGHQTRVNLHQPENFVSSSGPSNATGPHNLQNGPSNAAVASAPAKQPELLAAQRDTGRGSKAPTSQSASRSSDATAPSTPSKTPEDTSKAFPFQFGSISPSFVNGMQIPARTSSAPPNLDEQKRNQLLYGSFRPASSQPMPLPKHQLPRKDTGSADHSNNSGHTQPASKMNKDVQGIPSPSTPKVSQMQKAPVRPMSGMFTQMSFPQSQVPVQFGGPGFAPQIQSQGMATPSVPMPMPVPVGNASPVQQPMFVPGLQPHPMQPHGMMHHGQSLSFTNQMVPMPHQMGNLGLSPQYTQQQGGKYSGPRKTTVKITDPKTNEELKFGRHTETYSDGGVSSAMTHPNLAPQSRPVASYQPSHQVNYYPNSYNPNMYVPAPGSVPLISSQVTPNSQVPRYSYPVSLGTQNFSSMSPSSPRSVAASKGPATTKVPVSETTVSHGDKVDEKGESPRRPTLEKNLFHPPKDSLSSSESQSAVSRSNGEQQASNLLEAGKQAVELPSVSKESLVSDVAKITLESSVSEGSQESRRESQLADNAATPQFSDTCVPLQNNHLAHKSETVEMEKGEVGLVDSLRLGSKISLNSSFSNASESVDKTEQNVALVDIANSNKLVSAEINKGTDEQEMPTSTRSDLVEGRCAEVNFGQSLGSNGDDLSTLDSSSRVKENRGSTETSGAKSVSDQISASNTDSAEAVTKHGENADNTSSLQLPSFKEKTDPKKPAARGKKKRKEILQKADAQGTTTDLYNAYKGPEESKEVVVSTPNTDNAHSCFISDQVDAVIKRGDTIATEETGKGKGEPDDWEDAADMSSPKLETSGNKKVHSGSVDQVTAMNENISKRYSRDFLLKFAEQCPDLPDGFEIATDIAAALMSARPSGGHRLERRGSGLVGDDRWNKVPGSFGPGRDPRMDIAYGNNAGFRPGSVLRNPRGQSPMQFAGGILSGPVQNLGSQVGLQRNGSDADRWQRVGNFQQKGLIPSPQTPMQIMHRAEKKYEVGRVADEEEAKQRQLKAILNKLTPQNFEKLFEQVKAVNIDNAVTLTGVISQIFDKALMEPTFCEMYANFCHHLAGDLPDFTENNEKITFKRLLLNKCQEEFERGEREQEEANKTDEGESKMTDEEREEKRLKARRRMLGNIRLIGELYKKKMLTERIMHECIKKLLGQNQVPDEEDIEALCKLMATIGEMIDHPKARNHMDAYFEKMATLSNNMQLSSRVRFMLKDAIDLRKNKWQQRRKVEGPKKIEEVHRDAAQERQTQASRLARGPGINSSARRGPSDIGSRGPGLTSPNTHMGGYRGSQSQTRAYGAQDLRFEDRQPFEARVLSVPMTQRSVGEDSITLGPQGGLARGMSSTRGPSSISPTPDISPNPGDSRRVSTGLNGYGPASDRTPYSHNRYAGPAAYEQSAAQVRNKSYGYRDPGSLENSSNRPLPVLSPMQGQQPPVQTVASEKLLPEERLRDMSMAAIKEFYSARDEKEVALCIKDLNSPSFHPSMISLWVTDSFERKDVERNLLAKLLVNLAKSHDGLLSHSHLVKGFESVFSTLEDAVNDAPRASEFLGNMLAKFMMENVISMREIGQLLYEGGEEAGSLREVGLAADVLGSILEVVKSEKGDSALNEILRGSSLRLEDFRPPEPCRSKKLEQFF